MVEWFQKTMITTKKSKIARKIFATIDRPDAIEKIDIF